jgi:phosphohistidine phosphatase SixA
MLPRLIATLLLSITTVLAATPTLSSADEARCNSDKLGALSRAVRDTLSCRASAAMRGVAVPASCAIDVDADLDSAFERAVAGGGCASTDDPVEVLAALHAFDVDLADMLVTTISRDRCAADKVRVTARRAKMELACRRRAAAGAISVDPACIATAQEKLVAGFARRENRRVCATNGDASAVEDHVAAFLSFAAAHIDGTGTAPRPLNLSATIDLGSIDLTWTEADPGSGLTHSRLLRKFGAAVVGPDDAGATVVFDGIAGAATDDLTALLPNTTATPRVYHYAVFGCDGSSNCETTGSATTLTPTVREALKGGGYVLHWRHASADVCGDNLALGTAMTTMVPDWWKSCDSNCGTATARQLNSAGRAESVAIGDAFATLGITVGRVQTSEFCRNNETASLMDFGPAIEQSPELTYFVYSEASRCMDTFTKLAVVPTAGTNTALIGHAGNTCPPLSALAWAEAAIYKPDGLGGSTFIDRVLASAWLTLP